MKLSILVISFLFILIILMGWTLINQYRFLKIRNKRKIEIDSRYIELKYRIDLIVAAFSIIIAIAGLIGYSTVDEIKKDITEDIETEIDKIKKDAHQIDSLQKINMDFIRNFELEKEAINFVLCKSGKDAKKINEEITLLANKNIKNPNIYLCKFRYPKEMLNVEKPARIFFKNLKTINGQDLPSFKNAPMIYNSATNVLSLHSITNEYIEISQGIGNFDTEYIYLIIGSYDY